MNTITRRTLSSTLLRVVFGATLLCASNQALAAAAEPDLLALSVQGPAQAVVGSTVSVNALVINLGGPLSGNYTFDILLSTDTIVDEFDTVAAQMSSSLLGSMTIPSTIPLSLPPGVYTWAMRIAPVPGEIDLHNNSIIGGQVEVFVIDLQVSGATALTAFALAGGDNPAPFSLDVSNGGSANGILIFTVIEVPAVSWLSVNPSTSFTVAGGSPQPVQVSFNTAGLAAGTYATQLLFRNYQDPADYEVVPVTLTIGEVSFLPGDVLLGEVASLGETTEAVFTAVEGMKLKLKISSETGNLEPRVSILDEGGALVKSWTLGHSSKQVKKSVKLPATGIYRLRIEGADETLGALQIKTSAKLPKRARSFSKKIAPEAGTVVANVSLLSLENASIGVTAKPTAKFSGTSLDLTMTAPGGFPFDVSAQKSSLGNGGVQAEGVVLLEAGEYILKVSGFGSAKDKVKLTVDLKQELGGTTILLP